MTSITRKRSRCKNGTRKNKKTGNCESVLDKTCSICLDRIVSGNVTTKCKHKYHKKCLIGWCKGNKDKPTCPICRKDIKETCKKIEPFDSHEVFRYTRRLINVKPKEEDEIKEEIRNIINHKDFDPNIKQENGVSLICALSQYKHRNHLYKNFVEDIFKKYSNVVIDDDVINEIISNNNTEMINLYKKYKKIPKRFRGLV